MGEGKSYRKQYKAYTVMQRSGFEHTESVIFQNPFSSKILMIIAHFLRQILKISLSTEKVKII